MEILHTFGFDIQLFIAQVINFLILAYIFKRFLYKPLLKLVKNREETIQKGLQDAEDAAVALQKAEEKRDKIIKDASIEAKKIITEARVAADGVKDEMLEKARIEGEVIMKNAREQAQLEIERIEREGERVAVALAASLLEKTLGDSIDKTSREKIIERTVSQIKKYEN